MEVLFYIAAAVSFLATLRVITHLHPVHALLYLVVALIALALIFYLLGAQFAAALEIHHELAAADHDGHEHSDTDLCQWVQYHTGHSLTGDVPVPCAFLAHAPPQPMPAPVLVSQSLPASRASRAPPQR